MSGLELPSFNLVDREWLPARTLAGEPTTVSLLDVFTRAHELRTLTGELATQVFAVTRLLLAVVHRAVGGPRDVEQWEQLWHANTLPADKIAEYLRRHRDRFDLFDPEAPFFQVAGLRTAQGETFALDRLIADVPNGRPFFTSRAGGDLSLSFAEAARWLVHCHAFDPSGIKSGADGDKRVRGGRGYPIGVGWSGQLGGVLAQGATVRDTLLLNLLPYNPDSRDVPAWERPQLGPGTEPGRVPAGPLDLYTWQSRRVRLVAEQGRVRRVLVCNGDPLPPQNLHKLDPHTRWRRSQAQEKKHRKPLVYMPLQHAPERVIWRGLQSMLPSAAVPGQGSEAAPRQRGELLEWLGELSITGVLERTHTLRLRTIGMVYGSNNSVTDEVVDDALGLHVELLRPDATALSGIAVGCVAAAEAAATAVGKLALTLAQAAGKVPPAKPGLPDPADVAERTRAIETAYAELDQPFRTWLLGLDADTDPLAAQTDWHRTAAGIVRGLAEEVVARAPATGWTARKVSGRVVTIAHAVEWFDRDLRAALPHAYTPAPA
ncbi:type I-E CRISPR-associated protein Cse1/CasA [Amycolatopsis lurida]